MRGYFGAGDTIGGSAHKFSSGSFTEGRIAGKSAVKYVMELTGTPPTLDDAEIGTLAETILKPRENFDVGRNEIVAGSVSPSYISPLQGSAESIRKRLAEPD